MSVDFWIQEGTHRIIFLPGLSFAIHPSNWKKWGK